MDSLSKLRSDGGDNERMIREQIVARGISDARVIGAFRSVPRDRFVFLFVFDYESVAERKNPWGVMRAFRTAFPDPTPGGPVLVLKTINAELHLPDAERVRVAASDPDVLVLDGYLAADERDALMERADAYVSLHRCEGWGLTLAEAMSRGKPVVATAYSGNLEFMTETNSWLIPYRLTDIAEVSGAYRDGGRWADPDIAAAARAMREIVENPAEAAKRGSEAARDLAARRASDAGPRAIARRLAVLRERVRPNGPRRQHPQSLPTREGTP